MPNSASDLRKTLYDSFSLEFVMKKSFAILMLAVLAITGCQKNEEGKTKVSNDYRNGRAFGGTNLVGAGTPVGSGTASDMRLTGVVVGRDDQDFNDTVKGFLNGQMPEEAVGYVNYQANDGQTGVFIGGDVRLTNGAVGSGVSNGQVASSSRLLVVVFDEFTGRQDDQGNTYTSMKVYLTQASGTVSGNQASLRFTDSIGEVTMTGTFDANYFTGQMRYNNRQKYDGTTPGGEGLLGQFQVPTCQFFRCN